MSFVFQVSRESTASKMTRLKATRLDSIRVQSSTFTSSLSRCLAVFFLKALLHCAIFRATCLATPFLQTFSHYETSCFTGVTLSNVSCKLSCFDDQMKLIEGTFSLAGATNVATQVAGQMLHSEMFKKFVATVSATCLAMIRATCLAMALRDKLHEKLHSVTAL